MVVFNRREVQRQAVVGDGERRAGSQRGVGPQHVVQRVSGGQGVGAIHLHSQLVAVRDINGTVDGQLGIHRGALCADLEDTVAGLRVGAADIGTGACRQ